MTQPNPNRQAQSEEQIRAVAFIDERLEALRRMRRVLESGTPAERAWLRINAALDEWNLLHGRTRRGE